VDVVVAQVLAEHLHSAPAPRSEGPLMVIEAGVVPTRLGVTQEKQLLSFRHLSPIVARGAA
jgi:hypothetical protein